MKSRIRDETRFPIKANSPKISSLAPGASKAFKALYANRRELKCACVGGSSNVPLGFISLTENLMMVAMAVWMAAVSLGFVGGHAM